MVRDVNIKIIPTVIDVSQILRHPAAGLANDLLCLLLCLEGTDCQFRNNIILAILHYGPYELPWKLELLQ